MRAAAAEDALEYKDEGGEEGGAQERGDGVGHARDHLLAAAPH